MTHERVVTLAVWLFLVAGGAPTLAQDESSEEPQLASDQSQAEQLAAARREKAQNLTPAEVSSGEARVRGLEETRFPFSIFQQGFHGFRPVMGGMPSGSGFVVGGGYVRGLESEVFTVSADARYSTRGFKRADVRLALPTAQSGRPIRAFLNRVVSGLPGLAVLRSRQRQRVRRSGLLRAEKRDFRGWCHSREPLGRPECRSQPHDDRDRIGQ